MICFKLKIAITKMIRGPSKDTEKGVQVSPEPSRSAQDNFYQISIRLWNEQKFFNYSFQSVCCKSLEIPQVD